MAHLTHPHLLLDGLIRSLRAIAAVSTTIIMSVSLTGKDDDEATTTAAAATPVTPSSFTAAEAFGASFTFAPSVSASSSALAVPLSSSTLPPSNMATASATTSNDNNPPSSLSSTVPYTYFTSKASSAATSARHLLTAGLLDEALTTLEGAIATTQSALRSQVEQQHHDRLQGKSDDTTTLGQLGEEENDIELHECMAPLHYLYGTTLLYVVEESDVMMADNNGGGGGEDGNEEPQHDDDDDDGEEDDDDDDDEKKHTNVDDENDNDKGKSNKEDIKQITVSDPAVDLEIAWENLDLARSIIHRLVDIHNCEEEHHDNSTTTTMNNGGSGKTIVYKSNDSSNTNDSNSNPQLLTLEQRNELLLDLAQVHVRLGDLQRQDDKSDSCIADYERALQLRKHVLGMFDKKVADCHFSLGQAYAEAPTRAQERDGRVNDFVKGLGGDSGGGQDDAAAGSNSSSSSTMTNERKAEYRRLSLEHYLACGHSFAGILASMCDTEYPYREGVLLSTFPDYSESRQLLPKQATDGIRGLGGESHTSIMSRLRQFVSTLVLPSSYLSSSHKQSVIEFNNIKEILDEIQEAMDSAEETECGLRSLSKMKANAKSGGGGGTDEVGGSSDGPVTTIGFGSSTNPSLSVSVFGSTTSTIGVGGTTSATATITTTNGIATAVATAPPTMMIVKKKKKNLVTPHAVSTTKVGSTISGGGGEDDLSSSKRHKTN